MVEYIHAGLWNTTFPRVIEQSYDVVSDVLFPGGLVMRVPFFSGGSSEGRVCETYSHR